MFYKILTTNKTYIFCTFFLYISLTSCFREQQIPHITVPQNKVLPSYDRYLIIQKPYVRVYTTQSQKAEVLYILRRGDYVVVDESGATEDSRFFWYKVSFTPRLEKKVVLEDEEKPIRGWVLILSPKRVSSREQAIYLSRQLLQN